ncbi:MAG: hypothetical protein ACI86C_000829, partial [Candidatus Latescibacterota bacterium]
MLRLKHAHCGVFLIVDNHDGLFKKNCNRAASIRRAIKFY